MQIVMNKLTPKTGTQELHIEGSVLELMESNSIVRQGISTRNPNYYNFFNEGGDSITCRLSENVKKNLMNGSMTEVQMLANCQVNSWVNPEDTFNVDGSVKTAKGTTLYGIVMPQGLSALKDTASLLAQAKAAQPINLKSADLGRLLLKATTGA